MEALFARVKYADEHIARLEAAIKDVDAVKAKYIRIEPKHDATAMNFNFTGYLIADPPHELSFIAGDALHNLRAALDNLTWALAERYSSSPNPRSKAQFVACKTRAEFADRTKQFKLQEIGAPALTLLESVQPFHAKSPVDAPLYLLTDLDNRHKHRDLVTFNATASIGEELVAVPMPGVPAPVPGDWELAGMSPPLAVPLTKAGSVIFSVAFGRPAPHVGFSMNFQIALHLTSAGTLSNLGVLQSLPALRDEVQKTLRLFQHLL